MTHDPRHEPVDCLHAVLHELAGSSEDPEALLRHGEQALHQLQRLLSEARAYAWGYEHRMWLDSWFPAQQRPSQPGTEWSLPEWLSTSTKPHEQTWFVPPQ